MDWRQLQAERNEQYEERYGLTEWRIKEIAGERTVDERFLPYFIRMADFLMELEQVRQTIQSGEWNRLELEDIESMNNSLYEDILDSKYGSSYANPSYTVKLYGHELGRLLSLLCAELRGSVPAAFENRLDYLTIYRELFLEIYYCFETEQIPDYKALKDIMYWYASDYCDVFLEHRIEEQIYPDYSFAADIIMGSDLESDEYLYRFGEYITQNELGTAAHLRSLPYETLKRMADVYTEGYRKGFVQAGIDLSKKGVVNLHYRLGFEKVIKLAAENFQRMGLRPVIQRAASSVIVKRNQNKSGYCGAIASYQYEYDHRQDQALFMDKLYIERKLEVLKNTFEKHKKQAGLVAGPAVIEVFGEEPFVPIAKEEAPVFDDNQRSLSVLFDSKSGQIINQYIKGEERSFTIVAYPVPDIGREYKAIFDEVIRINTLDSELYHHVQQCLIDALDQGEYVHIIGKGENKTDLKVQLYSLNNPEKETIFENCVADVNIPVGEVFTSPTLEGTDGVLHVSRVYLNGLQYRELTITFKNGMIEDYTCANFDNEEEGRRYIRENILHNHESIPLGEFAIGTNTTAYVAAKKYGIEDKLPVLIAEKMGPHFAVGDTCYTWSEDRKIYNPNGKEIVAKDNSVSILRKEDRSRAYFQCHTDITIPYEELEEISVVTKEGKNIILLKDGRFVLEGTEILNEPFKN